MVGKAEGESCAKKGRIVSEEKNWSPLYESSSAKENVRFDEGEMGDKEEGWR